MSESVDVYWSFRSPYSYLITPDLLRLREDFDVAVNLRVILPTIISEDQTLFDAANKKPIQYIIMDSARRADFLGLPIQFPQPDPIVQNSETYELAKDQPYIYRLCKLGVEAQRRGKGIDFAANVARRIWGGTENWHKGNHLQDAATECGLDLPDMDKVIENSDHLDEIEKNYRTRDTAGHWGVPTMVVRGEPFFGQDRIDVLRWRLDNLGLSKT